MKKVFALIAFMGVIALAACGSTVGGDDGDSCGGCGCTGGGGDKMDSSQSTIDMYVNGTIKASYWVQVHEGAEAGQYWETTMKMAGDMTMTSRWQVAAKDGDTVVVENQNKMDGPYMVSDYVLAYQVDTSKGMGEVNVTAAWIGKPGEKGQAIEIMEKPEPTCGGCAGEQPETEDFSGVELAGGTWEGTIYISGASKTWMASNGWFNGMIKMESGDTVNELTAFGTDAEPLLAWE
ncbi:MAG: hypothetical protein K8I27_06675 [Planctomycetes bacterium]|nr:hypothetical protein [Planctomycetota bacterium]